MLSMFVITASLCAPNASAEGLLNSAGAPLLGAGEGVLGAFDVVVESGAGAAGAAGV